ncbi:MAG TPA: EAL domain-containing protein [Burkholderiales bacterium]|nr:EAL domain-containing protein [Burkholderiales bacterium]
MSKPERIRVLLAEDVPTDAELELRELKRAGMRIEHRLVESEAQFRLELERFSPDVILSDFTMPQFDGMAALALAREAAPDVPFIFVSGTIGEEYAIRALKNGATDYVLKTNLVRLPAAVERALQEARERADKRATEHALDATRQRLESIFHSLPDVVWSVGLPERRLIYVSPAVAQVYGLTPEEALTTPGFWVDAIHPEDRERVMAEWPGSSPDKVHDAEYRIVRRDGVVRWINARRRVFTSAAGVPERVDGLVRDITDAVGQRERLARLSRIRDLLGVANAAFMRLHDRDELFAEFCHIAITRGGFVLARVVALDETGRLRVAAASPTGDDRAFGRIVEDYNRDPQGARSLLAQVLRTGRREVSNDVQADERIAGRAVLTAQGSYALALLPVQVENSVAAVAILRAREPGYFDHAELELLRELIANLEFALELQGKREKVDYLALYDALTGLPNRMLLRERLAQAIDARRGADDKVGLVLLDIERFKAINDTLGPHGGDRVLKTVAQRVAEFAGARAHAARVAGDQFAILMPAVEHARDVGRMVEAMGLGLLDTAHVIDGRELRVALKVGAALYPDDGADADALIRNAEAALRMAKSTGERFLFYTPHINARVAERLDLEAKLRRAVEREEFRLHFQPIVDLTTRRITGIEALLRWHTADADARAVSPAQFVPVLEETGLIGPVGLWVMREAVKAHRALAQGGRAAPRVAVNVSAIQLRTPGFVDDVRGVLEGAGEAAGLDLEITESLLMVDIEDSLRKLRAVRELGVHIALDDFGTGYSSLAYLSRLPIDTVKIDRGFIHHMVDKAEDTSIVSAILSLTHALELKAVAEGVETEEQAELLRLLLCDEMQGYLFSPPVPLDKLQSLLS